MAIGTGEVGWQHEAKRPRPFKGRGLFVVFNVEVDMAKLESRSTPIRGLAQQRSWIGRRWRQDSQHFNQ